MTILELKRHFKNALSERYTEAESAQIFTIFFYEKTGLDRFQQRRFSHQEILKSDEEEFLSLIEQLKSGKPYQQVLGHTEFFKLKFLVNEHVLIPRPETEELLEIIISEISSHLKNKNISSVSNLKILDIGTGSGVIPIVLKKKFPKAKVFALDVSKEALKIAKQNAEIHKAEIEFIEADYLNTELSENFDIIISNPPYIGKEEQHEIHESVKDFEPNIALFSPTKDALIFYRKIAKDCSEHLREEGMFLLEINQKLGQETLDLFKNFSEKKLLKDLSDNDRFVIGRK